MAQLLPSGQIAFPELQRLEACFRDVGHRPSSPDSRLSLKYPKLFGFERTAEIAHSPAESIARTAREFGQEDDITVLTLSLLPAGVLALDL